MPDKLRQGWYRKGFDASWQNANLLIDTVLSMFAPAPELCSSIGRTSITVCGYYNIIQVAIYCYFSYFCGMKRRIVTYGGYFERFISELTDKEIKKLDYIISLLETEDRLPIKFIKYLRDGLYELRMEYNGNIYRVFFIFDEDRIVVLFNGFQKKTQKTPENEIERALKIMEAYYADKQSSDK